jgi:hypothetical protein
MTTPRVIKRYLNDAYFAGRFHDRGRFMECIDLAASLDHITPDDARILLHKYWEGWDSRTAVTRSKKAQASQLSFVRARIVAVQRAK